jgi:hypothetical protein
MALLQLHCLPGASLRYAVCHTFSSSFLRSGSFCVLCLTSFIASCVSLHFVSFTCAAVAYAARRCKPPFVAFVLHHLRAAPAAHLFIPLHYATLRHSFTSVSHSPPAAFYCYARLAATVCVTGRRCHSTHAYKADALCHALPLHCVPIAPCVRFTGHPSRWHSQAIPSYLLHYL